jgi:Mn2+/Fe2+ NRAMP family transporter
MILPLALGVMLVGAHRRSVVGECRHPVWLTAAGATTALVMGALGAWTLVRELPRLFLGA